jgi:hypothetical protein
MDRDMDKDGERDEDRDMDGDGDTEGTGTFLWGIRPQGTTSEFEYLSKFETEFENNLRYDSMVYIELIHEKKQRPKISCYCPSL